jgi:hypothetical protein
VGTAARAPQSFLSALCSKDRAHSCTLRHLLLAGCRRLCPADKQGKRSFAPVMLGRLQRLGIDKTNPDDLTPEEVKGGGTVGFRVYAADCCQGSGCMRLGDGSRSSNTDGTMQGLTSSVGGGLFGGP